MDGVDPKMLGLLLRLPVFLFALTVHEYAHGWMAKRHGDTTAEEMGRLTLDPRAHLDPLGLLMWVLSAWVGFGFGWARPVPVQLGRCRNPLRAMFWVALAGPLSNLLQAAVACVLLLLMGLAGTPFMLLALGAGTSAVFAGQPLPLSTLCACLLQEYLVINLVLMAFNLIPLPPLDGGRIAVSVLPYKAARELAALERYGFVVLLLLMRIPFVGHLIVAPAVGVLEVLGRLVGGAG